LEGPVLIQIFGMGCPNCRRLEGDVRAIIAEWKVDVAIERIDDPQQIVEMGIFSLPQLAVDGEIVSRGYRDRQLVEDALRRALG
jgi:small redox-active disulfide protein 2